jgi:hypothetical protein
MRSPFLVAGLVLFFVIFLASQCLPFLYIRDFLVQVASALCVLISMGYDASSGYEATPLAKGCPV